MAADKNNSGEEKKPVDDKKPVEVKKAVEVKKDDRKPVEKKPKKRGKVATFFKESFSELKKVSWPSFSTVFKTTLVVLGVVAVFLVVLLGFDTVLGIAHDALLK